MQTLDRLRAGTDDSEAGRGLARRLVDYGMANPRPPRSSRFFDVAVVVPVRDRNADLDRCLDALAGGPQIVVVDDGSVDGASVASICKRHGAAVVRFDSSRGAAAARNAGLAAVDSEYVAFVDSDCIVPADWLDRLADYFADPLTGAVAPRIRPVLPATAGNVLTRFIGSRSPLDLGSDEGGVRPGSRLPYVPTAALVVRRVALGAAFDPALRYGEDVDLVWRLHDTGWRVLYVPAIEVEHMEPGTWRAILRRRFNYGTSAAPLARRHPGRLTHAVLRPWPTAIAALLFAGRRNWAIGAGILQGVVLSRRDSETGKSGVQGLRYSAESVGHTVRGAGHAATMFFGPGLLAALLPRATRRSALTLLVVSPLAEWARRRPKLEPVRWTLACIADDIAYGLGVWRGCAAHATIRPLVPAAAQPHERTPPSRPL